MDKKNKLKNVKSFSEKPKVFQNYYLLFQN